MTKSTAAQAASLIRKEIKTLFPSVKFTCKSQNYAGGNSITVSITDQPKEISETISNALNKYSFGHFDGMTDCYEYSNVKDIPQVKFLFVNNNMSEEKKEEIYQNIKKTWHGGDELPETYNEGVDVNFQGNYISQMVWQEFCGA